MGSKIDITMTVTCEYCISSRSERRQFNVGDDMGKAALPVGWKDVEDKLICPSHSVKVNVEVIDKEV